MPATSAAATLPGMNSFPERVGRFALRLRNQLSSLFGPQPEWIRKKQAVDAHFDQANGVDTGGITGLEQLQVAGDLKDGTAHIASDPDEFHRALRALGVDFSLYTFVDLGSGKGRALLLAAGYGFRRLVGVEFARELVDVAKRNIRVAGDYVASRTSMIQQDATQYELPDEPLVLFMYNPFGARTMAPVAQRTRAWWERNRRPLHVVYVVPKHLDAWTDAGFVAEQRDHYAILRPAAH